MSAVAALTQAKSVEIMANGCVFHLAENQFAIFLSRVLVYVGNPPGILTGLSCISQYRAFARFKKIMAGAFMWSLRDFHCRATPAAHFPQIKAA
ncbi:hypothetical protein BH10PSE16_BH10PSE16_01160 [soil metagenome]